MKPPPNLTLAPDSLDDPPASCTADAGARVRTGRPAHPRYTFQEVIGIGGMGEVWRAWDQQLERLVALKVLRAELGSSAGVRARFVEEARATARLQHPGVVPVYEAGVLDDGRAFFTMREIRGRTLASILDDLHAVSTQGRWGQTTDGWTLHRVVDGFRRACEAVAHAHARGWVHRDLKPDNVMAGPHGEILVLDWGIAVRTAAASSYDPATSGVFERAPATVSAGVAGTPAWMAPEQARGEAVSLATDVHALGSMLHAILHGVPPFLGEDADSCLEAVRAGRRRSVRADARVPAELSTLVEACLEPDSADRPADAAAVAQAVRDWQEGARRREEADAHVRRAAELRNELSVAQQALFGATRAARLAAAEVAAWKPVEDKASAWALEDAAQAASERVAELEDEILRELETALRHVGDHEDAHRALADVFRARLEDAEEARDPVAVRRAAARVAQHDQAGRFTQWLRGEGVLVLETDVPARATLWRFETRGRRLVAEAPRPLGMTPIRDLPLDRGSWLVTLEAPGRVGVRVPVCIARGERWAAERPDGSVLRTRLPEALPAGVCLVPEGPFRCGGDPQSPTSRAAVRPWVEAFLIDRTPVTNLGWIGFLDDLVAQGREEEALRCVPRARDTGGQPMYGRTSSGGFCLQPDAEGDLWRQDWPVVLVDAEAAELYARWRAQRDGRPWRLPSEAEWEKAARGVDGRWLPWGDSFDASWACVRESHRGRPLLQSVEAFPGDESVYGVRGLAGGVRDLCRSDDGGYAVRGGAWSMVSAAARAAHRVQVEGNVRAPTIGVRLACSL